MILNQTPDPTEPPAPSPRMDNHFTDELPRLYAVANDGEADVLDRLRQRAGFTWACPICHWINITSESATQCEQKKKHTGIGS